MRRATSLRAAAAILGMAAVIAAMYAAATVALERPRLLRIDAASASTLTADYSIDARNDSLRPPLDPAIVGAAAADDRALSGGAPAPLAAPTATPLPTVPPPSATPEPAPTATFEPEPTPSNTPEPDPTSTDTPQLEPSPTSTPEPTDTSEPDPTRTPDPCRTAAPSEGLAYEGHDDACPTATPYKTPYVKTPHAVPTRD